MFEILVLLLCHICLVSLWFPLVLSKRHLFFFSAVLLSYFCHAFTDISAVLLVVFFAVVKRTVLSVLPSVARLSRKLFWFLRYILFLLFCRFS